MSDKTPPEPGFRPSVLGKISSVSHQGLIPYSAIIELTHRCNEKCLHCYLDHPSREKAQQELTTAEIRGILDQLADAGTLHLSITGGEIFLRRDIWEIIEHARSRHFAINLLTNATMIDEAMADRIKAVAPWEMGISVYGATAETHDKITQFPGSFKKTIAAITMLKARGLKVNLKCTLMNDNVAEFDLIKTLGDRLGVKYTIDPLITPGINGSSRPCGNRISDEDLHRILSDKKFNQGLLTFGTREYSEGAQMTRETYMCKAGTNFLSIDPYGNVFPCIQFQMSAGNLRETSFAEIWANSAVLKKIRQTTMADVEKCSECSLLPICFRCPGVALLEDGDAFGPSSFACRTSKMRRLVQEKRPASDIDDIDT
jgi:radical SAM protein with 4Fe4S-binding SPASM domain